MVILIFGISNVGKTVTGGILAQKLDYPFIDMDQEIKERFHTTMENFVKDHPFPHGRSKVKGKLLQDLFLEYEDNFVLAVSPIYYASNFNRFLKKEKVIAIELQDTEEHIFDRLIFSDEQDRIYKDDAYKNRHKKHYLKNIHADIMYFKNSFRKIENKYFMNNQSPEQVADDLLRLINRLSENRLVEGEAVD